MIVCMHVPPAPFFLSVHPWNTYFCVCVIERQILWGQFLQISIRFFLLALLETFLPCANDAYHRVNP